MQDTVKQYARVGRKDRRYNRVGLLAQMYMDIERLRVAQQVRQTHLKLDGSPFADDPTFALVFEHLQQAQGIIDEQMKPLVLNHPCWTEFNLYVKGIGPHLLALVVGLIRDVTPLTTVSKLWYLCGLAVLDGQVQRPHEGEVLNYDARLKSILLGRVGPQFLKNGDPFARKLYDEFKAKEEAKLSHEPEETQGIEASQKEKGAHIDEASHMKEGAHSAEASHAGEETHERKAFSPHRRAIRKVVKLWVACLWDVWRRGEGLPVSQPYATAVLGHDDHDLVTAEKWVAYNKSH